MARCSSTIVVTVMLITTVAAMSAPSCSPSEGQFPFVSVVPHDDDAMEERITRHCATCYSIPGPLSDVSAQPGIPPLSLVVACDTFMPNPSSCSLVPTSALAASSFAPARRLRTTYALRAVLQITQTSVVSLSDEIRSVGFSQFDTISGAEYDGLLRHTTGDATGATAQWTRPMFSLLLEHTPFLSLISAQLVEQQQAAAVGVAPTTAGGTVSNSSCTVVAHNFRLKLSLFDPSAWWVRRWNTGERQHDHTVCSVDIGRLKDTNASNAFLPSAVLLSCATHDDCNLLSDTATFLCMPGARSDKSAPMTATGSSCTSNITAYMAAVTGVSFQPLSRPTTTTTPSHNRTPSLAPGNTTTESTWGNYASVRIAALVMLNLMVLIVLCGTLAFTFFTSTVGGLMPLA